MPNGDYLWRVNDHGKTHPRDCSATRVLDAEAYDEFGKAMQAYVPLREADPQRDSARSLHAEPRAN